MSLISNSLLKFARHRWCMVKTDNLNLQSELK